jgi:hypothetical protein
MRDTNLLGTIDAAVAADAFAADAIAVNKTPATGVWVQFVIKRNGADADETLDITIYGKDTDASWAVTDQEVGVVGTIVNADVAAAGTIIREVLVQTKLKYICPHYNVTGTTPSYDITYGVVSGPARDSVA